MNNFSLDQQIFYTGPPAPSKSTSRRVLTPSGNSDSVAIPEVHLRRAFPHTVPLQNAHDPRPDRHGSSPGHAVLISDGNSDCVVLNDAALLPLEELLPAPRNAAQPNDGASTYKDANATSGDNEAKKHSVCAGDSCREGFRCPKHPNLSGVYRRQRLSKAATKANNALSHPYTLPGGSSNAAETEQNGRSVPQRAACSAETCHDNDNNNNKDCFPWASSGSQEGTLHYDKNNTSDLATADSEITPQPPDSQDQIDRRRDIRDYNTHPPVRVSRA